MKKTLEYLIERKRTGQKITALTSYDYPTTVLLEEAGVDMIILGDSVGTNVLGYRNETEVTMEDMVYHAKAVCRAKKDSFLVVDLPYGTHETPGDAIRNAKRLVDLGADAVKFEGIKEDILVALKNNGITVMCHIGLNPQYDQERMARGRVSKGKFYNEAVELLDGARRLECAGANLMILEKIPARIAKIITANIGLPTVGIGAGEHCDGQVLIIYDLLGISPKKYKHVPEYIDLRRSILKTMRRYQTEVAQGVFPDRRHINTIQDDAYETIAGWCGKNGFKL
jgi:3-methyl-2-oxobutanoate hydroxymethyltransferase